jgi:uncharacterized protein YdaU (DUF1376 family)
MAEVSAWMPFYIGDYLADTMHLTTEEHGAYVLLILHYWRSGQLPDDDKALAGITKVDRKAWIAEIGPTIRPFFVPRDGKLHHKRVDAELAKAIHNSSKRRAAANARWEQTQSTRNANGYANASGLHAPSIFTTHDPRARSPSPSPKKESDLRSVPQSGLIPDSFDSQFWPVYPRKVGRDAARKEFAKALKRAALDDIMAGLRRYSFSAEVQYQPHASTWLSEGRWQVETDTAPPSLLDRSAGQPRMLGGL